MTQYWRMAMREGSQGPDRFPDCCDRGIAALDYWDDKGGRIVKDCRKLTEQEYEATWHAKAPRWPSPRASLRHLWLHMKKGDLIYAKTGTRVVGKGRIVGEYEYDPAILANGQDGEDWGHFVRVDWVDDFVPFDFRFHAPVSTIMPLAGQELQSLLAADRKAQAHADVQWKRRLQLPMAALSDEVAAVEGRRREAMVVHRTREARLRAAKIQQALAAGNGRLRCEVPGCGFEFASVYGELGDEFAIVHHRSALGGRTAPSKTRLEDLAIVCANCHAMIHRGGKCRPLRGLIKGRRHTGL